MVVNLKYYSSSGSGCALSTQDGCFPRGYSSYGGTGGSTTHTHTTSGGSYQTSTVNGTTRKSGGTDSAGDHYHTMADGNTGSANHLPPYLDMLFASIDSGGYGEADSIVIFTALPPLGWTRYSDLDDTYPRGASAAGGTGGSTTHSHTVTIETGPPSSTSTAGGGLVDTSTDTHTHSCTDTTDSQSNLPAYMDVIFAKRKDPATSTTVGDKESNGSGGGLQGSDTYSYSYSGDGERVIEVVSTTNVITTVFIGNYYEYTITGTEAITKSYYYAGQTRVAMRDNGTLYFLLSDHLGSTSLTVDGNGSRISETRYSPWGSIRYMDGTMPTDFTFTGQKSETESFGLMFYGARWYDPYLNQMGQPDSIISDLYNPLDYNRYSYVRYNALKYTDPSGYNPECGPDGVWCDDDPYNDHDYPYMPDSYAPELTEAEGLWLEWEEICGDDCAYYVSVLIQEYYGIPDYIDNTNFIYWYPDCDNPYWSRPAGLFEFLKDENGFKAFALPYDAYQNIILPEGTPVFYNDGSYQDKSYKEPFRFNHAAIVVGQGRDSEGNIVPVVLDVNNSHVTGKHLYNNTSLKQSIWVILIGVYPDPRVGNVSSGMPELR